MSCPRGSLATRRSQQLALFLLFVLTSRFALPPHALAEDANSLVDQAQQAFEARQYDRADDILRRARVQWPDLHELEFNLGVNAEAARRFDVAVLHYRSYAGSLAGEDRREVETHALLLEQRTQRAKEPRRRVPWWVWGLIGGGVVAIGAGVAVAMSSDSGYEEY